MKITMIGHSKILLEIGGKRLLTDPYFGLHGEPGYARAAPPALTRQVAIPIHLGIRPRLPLLPTGQTPESFQERVRRAGLPAEVVILREGEGYIAQESSE